MEVGDTSIHSQSQVCSCGNSVMEKGKWSEKHESLTKFFFNSHENTGRGQAYEHRYKSNSHNIYIFSNHQKGIYS